MKGRDQPVSEDGNALVNRVLSGLQAARATGRLSGGREPPNEGQLSSFPTRARPLTDPLPLMGSRTKNKTEEQHSRLLDWRL